MQTILQFYSFKIFKNNLHTYMKHVIQLKYNCLYYVCNLHKQNRSAISPILFKISTYFEAKVAIENAV